MTRRVFRGKIGVQRVTGTLDPSQANYTRLIRQQMQNLENNLSEVIQGVKDVSADVLLDALTPTFAKSVVYCPKDTHRLVNSGYLEARETSNGATVEMGYGRGGDPFYAVYVHERTDIPHASPTRSKFLQAAIEEDSDAIPQRIAQGYQEAMSQ